MRILLVSLFVSLLSVPGSANADVVVEAGATPGSGNVTVAITDDEDEPDAQAPGSRNASATLGGPVEVKSGEKVREAVAIGGSTTVAGEVERDAVAIGGSVYVKKGAHVHGDVVAIGGTVDVEEGARVDGQRVTIGSGFAPGGLAGLAGLGALAVLFEVGLALLQLFGLIALGSLFVAFVPERLDRMKRTLVARPLPAGGVGLLALLGLLPATVLLVVTLVGILLVPFLWLLAGLLAVLGLTVVAQLIGERLPLRNRFRGPFATLALGALVLALARIVPFVGGLVFLAAMLVGAGSVLLTRFGAPPPESPVTPPGEHEAGLA